jgi:hypothetical protein
MEHVSANAMNAVTNPDAVPRRESSDANSAINQPKN